MQVPPPPPRSLPPVLTPPPPARAPSTAKTLLIVIAILFGVGLLFCGVLGGVVWKFAQEKPVPKQGFGQVQTVAKLPDGWARYHFDDLGMSLELPGKPEKGDIPMQNSDGVLLTNWSAYSSEGEETMFNIIGFWYRTSEWVDLKDDLSEYIEGLKTNESYKSLTHTVSHESFGILSGELMSGKYTLSELKNGAQVRVFAFSRGPMVVMLQADGADFPGAALQAQFRRVASSIQLD